MAYIQQFTTLAQPLTDDLQFYLIDQPTQQPPLDTLTDNLNNCIYTALTETVGQQPTRPKTAKWFWTPELQTAIDQREYCYRKWRSAIGMTKLTWWIKHQEDSAKVRIAVRTRRQQTWQAFCDRIANRDFSKAAAKLSKLKRGRTINTTYTHPDGPEAAANHMKEHLEQIFEGNLLATADREADHQPPTVPYLDDTANIQNPFQLDT
ncbi:hypothetical protein DFQ28_010161, partial [Apophysomyces sp. BC1034]